MKLWYSDRSSFPFEEPLPLAIIAIFRSAVVIEIKALSGSRFNSKIEPSDSPGTIDAGIGQVGRFHIAAHSAPPLKIRPFFQYFSDGISHIPPDEPFWTFGTFFIDWGFFKEYFNGLIIKPERKRFHVNSLADQYSLIIPGFTSVGTLSFHRSVEAKELSEELSELNRSSPLVPRGRRHGPHQEILQVV